MPNQNLNKMTLESLKERKKYLEEFLDEVCEYYYSDDAYECICPLQSDAAIELEQIELKIAAIQREVGNKNAKSESNGKNR
jgi:hypothetical protein